LEVRSLATQLADPRQTKLSPFEITTTWIAAFVAFPRGLRLLNLSLQNIHFKNPALLRSASSPEGRSSQRTNSGWR